jgi:hypothetical protein
MEKCFNCNKHKKPGSLFTKQGACFYICDDCSIDDIPDWKINQKAETWVSRNIREAKERRASGSSPWEKSK